MMKIASWMPSALQIVGISAVLVAVSALTTPWVGLLVGGVALGLLGWVLEGDR